MSDGGAFRTEPYRDFLAFERGLSDRTVAAYYRDVERLARFLVEREVHSPEEVSHVTLREYLFHLKEAGLAPTSIRRSLSSLRSYYGFLLEEGVVSADPTERLEAPKTGRTLPDVLTQREAVALIESPSPESGVHWRDRAILELLYATGIRVSELTTARIPDLDAEAGLLTVFGKGSRERIVPVGRVALGVALRYLRELRPRLDRGRGAGRDLPEPAGPAAHPDGGLGGREGGSTPGRSRATDLPATRSATRLPPTCWRGERTLPLCRSS